MSVMPATATASWAPIERKKEAMIVQKAISSRFTPPMSARPRPECGAAVRHDNVARRVVDCGFRQARRRRREQRSA